jgi:hypothetical protein
LVYLLFWQFFLQPNDHLVEPSQILGSLLMELLMSILSYFIKKFRVLKKISINYAI